MIYLLQTTIPPGQDLYGLGEHIGAVVAVLGVVFALFLAALRFAWSQNDQRHTARVEEIDTKNKERQALLGSQLGQIQASIAAWQVRDEQEHDDFRRALTDHDRSIGWIQGYLRIGRRVSDQTSTTPPAPGGEKPPGGCVEGSG